MDILFPALAIAVVYSFMSLRVLRQYERGVAFFLGRFWGTKGPGLVFIPAGFANQKRVSMRTMALDIPSQDVITRDNVSVRVNAVLYMRVKDPEKAVIEIEDYLYATSQLSQTTLRSVLGEVELDELLSDREKINSILRRIIDERTEAWGIEVSAVEVKDVDLPENMKRAMARQAEAERERRAKVINAQGELQASETLAQAAHMLAAEPSDIDGLYCLAHASEGLKDWRAVAELCTRALELSAGESKGFRRRFLSLRARSRMQLGDFAAATADIAEIRSGGRELDGHSADHLEQLMAELRARSFVQAEADL
jgi:regulator of protease activity HflC (stomatin/prohibitin superfamily)